MRAEKLHKPEGLAGAEVIAGRGFLAGKKVSFETRICGRVSTTQCRRDLGCIQALAPQSAHLERMPPKAFPGNGNGGGRGSGVAVERAQRFNKLDGSGAGWWRQFADRAAATAEAEQHQK